MINRVSLTTVLLLTYVMYNEGVWKRYEGYKKYQALLYNAEKEANSRRFRGFRE